jgi:hypothetical protein
LVNTLRSRNYNLLFLFLRQGSWHMNLLFLIDVEVLVRTRTTAEDFARSVS